MVRRQAINQCVNLAKQLYEEATDEIVEREAAKEAADPEYNATFTLQDCRRLTDLSNQIKHHIWIRENILRDNGESYFERPQRPRRRH
jgi:hypothetical protein